MPRTPPSSLTDTSYAATWGCPLDTCRCQYAPLYLLSDIPPRSSVQLALRGSSSPPPPPPPGLPLAYTLVSAMTSLLWIRHCFLSCLPCSQEPASSTDSALGTENTESCLPVPAGVRCAAARPPRWGRARLEAVLGEARPTSLYLMAQPKSRSFFFFLKNSLTHFF